ncbi:MAG: AraC family transcriptional regulator [Gammaproteobacteria bacterium]
MDALTSLLQGLNLRARVAYIGGVCGRWAVDHNSQTAIWFHLLVKGRGWGYSSAWDRPLALEEGDLLLFMPHAPTHYLSYSSEELVFDAEGAAKVPMAEGSSGFACGLFELEAPQAPWWRVLPGEILIRRRDAGDQLARVMQIIVDEALSGRLASEIMIERLIDSCFLLVVRHCVERGLLGEGLLGAFSDRRLQGLLERLHREPARGWTLAELCAIGGMSKSVLSERFNAAFGCAPMEYLKAWRMQLAAGWLRGGGGDSIERIAGRCGYESVPAFTRAFRQFAGVAPGAYRRHATKPEAVAEAV